MEQLEYETLCQTYGKHKVDLEVDLEAESKQLAYDAYMATVNKNIQNKRGGDSGAAGNILKESVPLLTLGLKQFIKEADTGKPGRRHIAVGLIRDSSPELIAYITLKVLFGNILYHPLGIPLSSLAVLIGKEVDTEVRYQALLKQMESKKKSKVLIGASKRIGTHFKKAYMATVAKSEDNSEYEVKTKWTQKEQVQIGLKLVELMYTATGLIDYHKIKLDAKGYPTYRIAFKTEVMETIIKTNEKLADRLFKFRPMVIPPKPWSTPWDGGYYIDIEGKPGLVRIPNGRVHQLYDDVYMPEVYKAVNTIQATPWRINKKVLSVAQAVLNWSSLPSGLGMPEMTRPEPPMRPSEADENPEVHMEWKKSAARFYQEEVSKTSKRLRNKAILDCCESFKDYEAIYFPHNLDFRGRVYAMTIVSPQGDDFVKGLIEFSKGVPLGSEGATWLAYQGANAYGLDKNEMAERLGWVHENTEFIIRIANDPLSNLEWTDTDSPWEFLAFCFEWQEYQKQGERYESRLPVAFDGSCSGLQHYSALLRDEVGGKAVNLVPMDSVQDIYKIVADKVKLKVQNDYHNGTQDELNGDILKKGTMTMAKEWTKYGVDRYVTKRPVMTLAYGATQFGFVNQILEDTIYPEINQHLLTFSRPRQAAKYMADMIWESVHEVVVKAMEAMDWLRTASGLLATDRDASGKPLPTFWVTPAGFPVRQEYRQYNTMRINSILNNGIKIRSFSVDTEPTNVAQGDMIKISYNVISPKLDSRKQRNGIAPNFIHSLDASHLMLTVNACAYQGVDSFAMIHDSYGTHAGTASIMYKTVREVFVDTYTQNDILGDFAEHVKNLLSHDKAKELPELPKKGHLDLEGVKSSVYAFA